MHTFESDVAATATARKIITLVLGIILLTGTISSFHQFSSSSSSSSSFIRNAQAQPYNYNVADNNNNFNSEYSSSFVKDSKDIKLNKIKCFNDNININGQNTGDVNAGNKGVTEGNLGAYSSNNGEGYYNDKKAFDCLVSNKNTNTNTVSTDRGGGNSGGNQTTTPPPNPPVDTETLTVIKKVECQTDPATCEQNSIVPSNFTILIQGNNPSQNNFAGSSTGTDIELEAGQYNVTEQGLDIVTPQICTNRGFEAGRTVVGSTSDLFICTNFSDGCEGEIAIGNPQICTIENVLVETPTETPTETLTVIKNVDCLADAQTCANNPIQPSNFTIVIEEGNNPSQNNFPGSSGTGTNVELEAGPYNVTEQGLDVVTPQICSSLGYEAGSTFGNNLFICTNFSEECKGDIAIGNPQTCTIENVIVQAIVGATLSINKDWFGCNKNGFINCTIEGPEEQISFEGPNSGFYTECTSDVQCPFANDAGFNITINGSNPNPNTIPAQINTEQQVEIGSGPFSVSEELFSDRFVPNAIFDVEDVPVELTFSGAISLSFDETGQRLFIPNSGSNSVSIIDLSDNSVTNVDLSASGGEGPSDIAFDAAGQRVFTANRDSNSVSIIDLSDNNVTDVDLSASGGDDPKKIVFDAAGQRVFTANTLSNSVSIIDLSDNSVTNVDLSASGGDDPEDIVFDAAGQRVFTANLLSTSVSIIDLSDNSVTDVDLAAFGANGVFALAFDGSGQRVFTADETSFSVSIIDLSDNSVTNVDLSASGGFLPIAIAFDQAGQRVFTANFDSSSVSIIDLSDNSVTNVDLSASGGEGPSDIAFDAAGQRLFIANTLSSSVSIIDLSDNSVTNVDLSASGGDDPEVIAFDAAGQRVFTANSGSSSVSIISKPTVAKICQDSGFDTGDIRTFESNGVTFQQITCVNFVDQCSGNIDNGETRECTVQDYIVSLEDLPTNGDRIGILSSNIDRSQQQNQLFTNDISSTGNKIQTSSVPTGPFIYDMPIH